MRLATEIADEYDSHYDGYLIGTWYEASMSTVESIAFLNSGDYNWIASYMDRLY